MVVYFICLKLFQFSTNVIPYYDDLRLSSPIKCDNSYFYYSTNRCNIKNKTKPEEQVFFL